MVFIINGKLYDTEKATKITAYMQSYPSGELFGHTMYLRKETTLYKTQKGNWFTTVKGDYDKYTAYKISEENAKQILTELNAIDLYNKYFEALEEA